MQVANLDSGANAGGSLMNRELIQSLREQRTVRLLALNVVTLGIYGAHYMVRQSTRLNAHLAPEKQISRDLTILILVTSYAATGMALVYFFQLPLEHPLVRAADATGLIASVLKWVWGFKMRNRMNVILGVKRGEFGWFSGIWTLLFTPLYFNFKVNELHDVLKPTTESGSE